MKRVARRAFTLLELLIVIGIIIALAGLLLPALNHMREEGKRVQCLSNLRQLTTAWLAYATDNNRYLCSSQPPPMGSPTPPPTTCWIGAPDDAHRIQHGSLWSYLNSESVYRCPDDLIMRASSYQINGVLRGTIGAPHPLKKLDDINQPAKTFVFIEGCMPTGFLVDCFQTEIYPKNTFHKGGWPGQNHHGSSAPAVGTGISFADGHAIFWQYTDPRTGSLLMSTVSGGNDTHVYDGNGNDRVNTDEAAPNSPDLYQLEAWSGGLPMPPQFDQ